MVGLFAINISIRNHSCLKLNQSGIEWEFKLEKADEIGSNGKQSLVHANRLDSLYGKNISYHDKRFVCRECGEYVSYVYRTHYNSFFRHHNNKMEIECALRRRGHATKNIYEKKGPLLVLCKSSRTDYSLMMRFTGVKEELISGTKYLGSTLYISNKLGDKNNKYCIDQSRFIQDISSYLHVSFSAERYYINYSPDSVVMDYSRKWGGESEGFYSNRMLFSCIGDKGYKIRVNDEIEINEPYYVVTIDGKEIERERFVEHFRMGSLKLQDDPYQYQVYKIVIRADTDGEFARASQYIRDKFKVNLVHQKVKVDLIWPPAVRGTDEINYFGRSGDAIYKISNGDQSESINVHQGYVHRTYQMRSNDYKTQSFSVTISDKNELMCLGENNSTLLYYLSNKRYVNIVRNTSKVVICDLHGNNLNGFIYALPQDATIKVSSNVKSELLILRNGIFYSRHKLNDDRIMKIQGIRYGDSFFWKYRTTAEKLVEFCKEKKELTRSHAVLSLDDITYLGRTYVVECKPWLRKVFLHIDMNAQLQEIIKSYIRKGTIPIGVEQLLYRKYCEMRGDIR